MQQRLHVYDIDIDIDIDIHAGERVADSDADQELVAPTDGLHVSFWRSRRQAKPAKAPERLWGKPQPMGAVIEKRESPDRRTFRIAETWSAETWSAETWSAETWSAETQECGNPGVRI